ncbi:unnamed protein product [Rangifer tarandus platyrhynchus]|uniref:Uncharacterized protein n=2 Tax=Rangifer tarandus platyrhynchus TaxID=3082113 RepID=A0ACB0DPZ7_RANTA|nr:unnamed protein product [Rangifer tarandus platyrhynchus]CAI9690333.1 unnamed protein product [Rangifer tarandus platyrhynchus]
MMVWAPGGPQHPHGDAGNKNKVAEELSGVGESSELTGEADKSPQTKPGLRGDLGTGVGPRAAVIPWSAPTGALAGKPARVPGRVRVLGTAKATCPGWLLEAHALLSPLLGRLRLPRCSPAGQSVRPGAGGEWSSGSYFYKMRQRAEAERACGSGVHYPGAGREETPRAISKALKGGKAARRAGRSTPDPGRGRPGGAGRGSKKGRDEGGASEGRSRAPSHRCRLAAAAAAATRGLRGQPGGRAGSEARGSPRPACASEARPGSGIGPAAAPPKQRRALGARSPEPAAAESQGSGWSAGARPEEAAESRGRRGRATGASSPRRRSGGGFAGDKAHRERGNARPARARGSRRLSAPSRALRGLRARARAGG